MELQSKLRCAWLDNSKADYVTYHDQEWGVPVYDDRTLFECLCLESAQAGLSWYTILKRRCGYRKAFANFDVNEIVKFKLSTVEELVNNPAIIRHRGKINAVISNAAKYIKIQQEFGSFCDYIWAFVNHQSQVISLQPNQTHEQISHSVISDKVSKDLRKRGLKFIGPTICFAYMQACGMLNGHSSECYRKNEIIAKFKQVNT